MGPLGRVQGCRGSVFRIKYSGLRFSDLNWVMVSAPESQSSVRSKLDEVRLESLTLGGMFLK